MTTLDDLRDMLQHALDEQVAMRRGLAELHRVLLDRGENARKLERLFAEMRTGNALTSAAEAARPASAPVPEIAGADLVAAVRRKVATTGASRGAAAMPTGIGREALATVLAGDTDISPLAMDRPRAWAAAASNGAAA